jgi:hypothetical protein
LKISNLIGVAAATISLIGCGVSLNTPGKNTTASALKNLRYVQDPATNLCFALISTSHATTLGDDGMTITWVPCDPTVLEHTKK